VQSIALELSDVPTAAAAAALTLLLRNQRPRGASPALPTNPTHIQAGVDSAQAQADADEAAAQVISPPARTVIYPHEC
jgi:hypothetical protein